MKCKTMPSDTAMAKLMFSPKRFVQKVVFCLLLLLGSSGLKSQSCETGGCPVSISLSQNPEQTFETAPAEWTKITTTAGETAQMKPGNYTLFNVVSGKTYEWSYCEQFGGASTAWDAQLTLYDESNTATPLCFSDDACDGLAPYLSWKASFTGMVRVLTTVYVEGNCQTISTETYNKMVWRITNCAPVSISVQPQNQTAYGGSTATFSITSVGTGPLLYAWYKNGEIIYGASNSSYTTPTLSLANNGETYYCVTTNCNGESTIASSTVTLTVIPCSPVSILSQPQHQTIFIGSTATFSLTPDGTAPFQFAWYRNWEPIPGATNSSYTTPTLTIANNGDTYYCIITNCNGDNIVTSMTATLTISTSPPPAIEWQKSLGGSNFDYAYSIQQTTDGGYIVAGLTDSYDGDVSGNHSGGFSSRESDFWVVKLDANGAIQWQKCLGGSNTEVALSIQQTADGGYVVAGYTKSNDGDVSGYHGIRDTDFWVVKLDANGAIQWQKCLGGSDDEWAQSIQQVTDGGYIMAGITRSNDGDVFGNHGSYDLWVVKLDATGSIQWQKCLGGSSSDDANSIKQTVDGGYIVAGNTNSYDGDVSGNHGGYADSWVAKLDADGVIQWQKCLGGSSYDDASSIQQATDGGYVVAGYTKSNDGDVSGYLGVRDADFWVVKLDANGAIQWQKCLGGSDADYAYSIQQAADGGYIVAGNTYSNDGDVSGNHGSDDFWVVKLDTGGTIQWQKCLGGNSSDDANSIRQTADGGYIVAGITDSYDGDVTGKHGNSDFWIVKLRPPCPKAMLRHDTTVHILCPSQTINLTGFTEGKTLFGATWDADEPTSAGIGVYQLAIDSAGCRDTLHVVVKQDTKIWKGNVSSDWHDPLNWSGETLPGENSQVIIPPTAAPCVLSSADATVASLQVVKNSIFRVENGHQVRVNGTCDYVPPMIKPGPRTLIVDSVTESVIQSVDSATVVFSGKSEQLDSLTEGSIIVSGIAPNAPYGFLRRITGIQKSGDTYTLATSDDVLLEEAFEELHLDFSKQLSDDDTCKGCPQQNESEEGTHKISINVVVYDKDGDYSTKGDQVKVDGYLEVLPTLSVSFDISKFRLLGARLEGKFSSELTLSPEVGGISISRKIPVGPDILFATFTIPGTIIPVTTSLSLSVGVEGSVSVPIRTSNKNKFTSKVFLEYRDGQWNGGSSKTMTNTLISSNLTGKAEVKVYAQPSLDFKVLNMDGVSGSIYLQGYVKAEGQISPLSCEIRGGISGGVEANLELTKRISYNQDLKVFDVSEQILACPTIKKPTVSTAPISSVTSSSATSGGTITDDGGAPVTAKGVCWNTSGNPNIDNTLNKTVDGSGTESFTSNINGLSPSTTYHVRAYATNSAGTNYGNDVPFITAAATSTRIISLSGNLSFGDVTVGQTATRTLTISNSNSSTSSLTVTSISLPQGFVRSNSSPINIPVGGSVSVTITFSPTSVQSYGGDVTVISNRTSGTNTKSISGNGISGSTPGPIVVPAVGTYSSCVSSNTYTCPSSIIYYLGNISARVVSISPSTNQITFEIKRCANEPFVNAGTSYIMGGSSNYGNLLLCGSPGVNFGSKSFSAGTSTIQMTITDNNMVGTKVYIPFISQDPPDLTDIRNAAPGITVTF